MATFTVTINLDNAAFDDRAVEIARILFDIRRKVANGHTDGPVMDVNGNTVGTFETKED